MEKIIEEKVPVVVIKCMGRGSFVLSSPCPIDDDTIAKIELLPGIVQVERIEDGQSIRFVASSNLSMKHPSVKEMLGKILIKDHPAWPVAIVWLNEADELVSAHSFFVSHDPRTDEYYYQVHPVAWPNHRRLQVKRS